MKNLIMILLLLRSNIFRLIKNSSDLFERSHETFNYIDVNDNTYLPYKYEEFKHILNKYI